MSGKHKPKHKNHGNADMMRAMQGLRFSGAAGKHTPRPRKGSRAQRERDAIRDARRQS